MSSNVVQAGELRSSRLESLRAVAALGVLIGHTYGTSHLYARTYTLGTYEHRLIFDGGLGVYLFFALSGYLLFLPFARRDLAAGRAIDLRQYARNRALRILPLYFVVVVVVLLLQENGGSLKQWALFLSFSENYSLDTLAQVNGVLWSLVVELHFYILLPFLSLVVGKVSRGSILRAALLIGGLGLASFALRHATFYSDLTPDPYLRYSLPSTFFFFTAGMLLVLLRLHWDERPPRWLRGPLGEGSLWVVVAAAIYLVIARNLNHEWLSAAMAFLLVGACVLPLRPGPLVKALEWRWLAAIGVASYSLYMWHVPLLDALDNIDGLVPGSFPKVFVVTAPVCLAVAFASYAIVERPFLRLRKRWGSTASS